MERAEPENGLAVVHEDNHLLAVAKPCGLPCQPDASGDPSVAVLMKQYVKVKYQKPGDVYLALLHRLDRPTSGLVLLARTDKAAGRMAELFRQREIEKTYLALVECGQRPQAEEELRDWLIPAGNGGMRRAEGKSAGAKEAVLRCRCLGLAADAKRALMQVELVTGVKHQIRCQLAARGMPVVGDFRYGPYGRPARPEPVLEGRGILLHAWRVGFIHPVRRERLELTAPPPPPWRGALRSIAGVDAEGFRA